MATGPAKNIAKFQAESSTSTIHFALSAPPKNTERYMDSTNHIKRRATTPYIIRIFHLSALSSEFHLNSIVNQPQVNINTAVAIMSTSRNFMIAMVLLFPQKFCVQKK